MNQDKEYILKIARDKNVRFVRLWFSDILGNLKSFAINIDELEDALAEGVRFDGSTLSGVTRTEEHELLAVPDPETFQILPWRPKEDSVARMFCDIYKTDMTPYEGDSRFVLKRALKKAADKGYIFYTGPEIEFFFLKNSTKPEFIDRGGYFDLTPLDTASDYRRQTVLTLQQMGIDIISSHHEGAFSQHEIDLRYQEGLIMADYAQTYRVVVKEVARKHGCYATFMPKPLFGENGSGMHCHQSLFRGAKNAFYDASDPYHLSGEAKGFIAGLLCHAPEFTLITNQWVNSYKRLVPGYEAPVYIAWARRNRSALVRVPMYKPGKESATRIELRSPDPACNLYLSFAAMLGAGLKGIEEGYTLSDPIEENIFKMTDEEMEEKGVTSLPGSLREAVDNLEKSELMREVLGDHLHAALVENKKAEWDAYRTQVTEWEIERYLPIL